MKKNIGLGLIVASAFLPGIALAQDVAVSSNASVNAQTAVQDAGIEMQGSANASVNANVNAGTNAQGNATSSSRNEGQQGEAKQNKADASAKATSSENKPAWGQKGGLVAFLRGIFGLSTSSTTVEVKSSIEATTTATSEAKGLGFWARFMGFLGINN